MCWPHVPASHSASRGASRCPGGGLCLADEHSGMGRRKYCVSSYCLVDVFLNNVSVLVCLVIFTFFLVSVYGVILIPSFLSFIILFF